MATFFTTSDAACGPTKFEIVKAKDGGGFEAAAGADLAIKDDDKTSDVVEQNLIVKL